MRTATDELVRCARALVGGETRRDYGFVVRDGRIAAEFARADATPDRVIAVATGAAA